MSMEKLAVCVVGFVKGREQNFGTGNEQKDRSCEEPREEHLLVSSFELLDESMSVGQCYPGHLLFSHVPGHVCFRAACAYPGNGTGDARSVKHD